MQLTLCQRWLHARSSYPAVSSSRPGAVSKHSMHINVETRAPWTLHGGCVVPVCSAAPKRCNRQMHMRSPCDCKLDGQNRSEVLLRARRLLRHAQLHGAHVGGPRPRGCPLTQSRHCSSRHHEMQAWLRQLRARYYAAVQWSITCAPRLPHCRWQSFDSRGHGELPRDWQTMRSFLQAATVLL